MFEESRVQVKRVKSYCNCTRVHHAKLSRTHVPNGIKLFIRLICEAHLALSHHHNFHSSTSNTACKAFQAHTHTVATRNEALRLHHLHTKGNHLEQLRLRLQAQPSIHVLDKRTQTFFANMHEMLPVLKCGTTDDDNTGHAP